MSTFLPLLLPPFCEFARESAVMPGFSRQLVATLVLRPSEAKRAPLRVLVGVEVAKERRVDVGVEGGGRCCCDMAREG